MKIMMKIKRKATRFKMVEKIITQTNANSIKDMGKVMGIATKKLAGKSDNKTISDIVKNY